MVNIPVQISLVIEDMKLHNSRFISSMAVLLFLFAQTAAGQIHKPPLTWKYIDQTDLSRFSIRDLAISDNSDLITYMTNGKVVLQSIKTSYQRAYPLNSAISFIPKTNLIVRKTGDSLIIYRGSDTTFRKAFSNVEGSQLVETRRGILYLIQSKNALVILNLLTLSERRMPNVTRFSIFKESVLYLKQSVSQQYLCRYSLSDHYEQEVFHTKGKIENFIEDDAGSKIALTYTDSDNVKLFTFDILKQKGADWDAKALHIRSGFSFDRETLQFAARGTVLILSQDPPMNKIQLDSSKNALNIWNYKDRFLPKVNNPAVFEDRPPSKLNSFRIALNLATVKTFELDSPEASLYLEDLYITEVGPENGSYVLKRSKGYDGDNYLANPNNYQLINLLNGQTRKVPTVGRLDYAYLSPDGTHILFYSSDKEIYYSYNTLTAKIKRLTNPANIQITDTFSQRPTRSFYGIAGWVDRGDAILIYDKYDVWKLDITARHTPICITDQVGSQTNTMLRLVQSSESRILDVPQKNCLSPELLILEGQNLRTKEQSLYDFDIAGNIKPKKLLSGKYCLNSHFYDNAIDQENGNEPRVARSINGRQFLIAKSSLDSGINLYLLQNSRLKQLTFSDLHAGFNWLTSEMLNWTGFDKKPNQGILYKPENFDPKKKYPVIVTYYEKNSSRLNACGIGESNQWSAFIRNIGYFISNGYLVFVPDIQYKIGDMPGSVYNSVVPGVRELIKRRYVNAKCIGAAGQSWGGYETMWLVTKSKKLFACAFAENGGSDMFYASYLSPDFPLNGQLRVGSTPWQRPDIYVQNSAALQVLDIQTPLCLSNNDLDSRCPIPFGIEMFEYLRILKKPVWLLQYNNESHGIYMHKENVDDYRIRFQQFFDHYLKGAPAPLWMSRAAENRPASAEATLQLDTNKN